MALPPSSAAGVELPGASQDEQHLRITTDATSIAAGQSPSGPKTQPQPTGLLLFLSTHLSRGRLDAGGYNMLRAVLQMLSEISLLLFPSSHVLEARVMRRIEKLSRYIISTFHTIGEHIDTQLERARQAMRELPELKVAHEKSRRRHLKIWRRRLRTLHEPSRNDVLLYRYFLIFFDSQVHAPFLQLHREEPQHNSWQLRDFFNHIRDCLNSLQENIEDANKIVTELDKEFTFGSWEANDGLASGNKKEGVPSLSKAGKGSRARPAPSTSTDDMLTSFADFFDSVEAVDHDDDGDHDHDNSMNARTEYGIAPGSSGPGSTTPRVFTGSFDELEESVKSLRLEQLNLTDDNPGTGGTVRVKDFALPTPCLLPSPATLLERREALSVREPTWEHGTSGGNVLHSRRPHDRNRAQTVDERGGGLDAWLAESPSPGRAMERISSVHSRVLHRQQTL